MMSLSREKKTFPVLFYFLSFATVGFGFVLPVLSAAVLSLLIFFALARIHFAAGWAEFLSVQPSRGSLFWFLGSFFFAFCAAGVVLKTVHAESVTIQLLKNSSTVLLVTILLQALSEEILFRVFLMRELFSQILKTRFALIAATATLFSLAHLVNYFFRDGVYLSWSSLISLFLLGYAGSMLFFKNLHLWGVLGFHAGWNFVRFSSEFSVNNMPVMESQRFELLEGSQACLLLAVILCLASRYPPEAANARR